MELLEVPIVNVVAPFLLLDRLRPVLTAPGPGRRYVVNVTGREGWFGGDTAPERKARRAAAGWRPPLDVVDATARIYQPIIAGEAGAPLHGVLVKNYTVVPW